MPFISQDLVLRRSIFTPLRAITKPGAGVLAEVRKWEADGRLARMRGVLLRCCGQALPARWLALIQRERPVLELLRPMVSSRLDLLLVPMTTITHTYGQGLLHRGSI